MKLRFIFTISAFAFLNLCNNFAFAACYDPRDVIAKARNGDDNTGIIAMHRGVWGDGTRLPENSFGAFLAADLSCIPAIETDVRLTKDNVLVMIHDKSLGRTTDIYSHGYSDAERFLPEEVTMEKRANPPIDKINWERKGTDAGVVDLKLLVNPNIPQRIDPSNISGYGVETVQSFYDKYYDNRMSTVVFLEVKEKAAVLPVLKQLFEDQRDYSRGLESKPLRATEFTILKFNVGLFPVAQEYGDLAIKTRNEVEADAARDNKKYDTSPIPLAFPAYTSNILQAMIDATKDLGSDSLYNGRIVDPWKDSVATWIESHRPTLGIELNLKDEDGILQEYYDKLSMADPDHPDEFVKKKVSLGTFHAVPDFLRVNPDRHVDESLPNLPRGTPDVQAKYAFYDGGSGECCYQLSDRLNTEWKGKKDLRDRRDDASFIVGQRADMPDFKLITTDDYGAIAREFINNGGTIDDFKISPLAETFVMMRNKDDEKLHDNVKHGNKWYGDEHSGGYPFVGSPAATRHKGEVYEFELDPSSGNVLANTFQEEKIRLHGRIFRYWGDMHDLGNRGDLTAVSYKDAIYLLLNQQNHLAYSKSSVHAVSDKVVFSQPIEAHDKDLDKSMFLSGSPSSAVLDNKIYTVYSTAINAMSGAHLPSDQKQAELYFTIFDGNTWTKPQNTGLRTYENPAVISHRGKLFVFHEATDNKMLCTTFDGKAWSDSKPIGLFGVKKVAPTLANGNIVIYYRNGQGKLASKTMASSYDHEFNCTGWSNEEIAGDPMTDKNVRIEGTPAVVN